MTTNDTPFGALKQVEAGVLSVGYAEAGPAEAKLNALPHFMTEIDGLDIHFIHARSSHEDALR
jgi:hypothetical protein